MSEVTRSKEDKITVVRTFLWAGLLTLLIASAGIAVAGSSDPVSNSDPTAASPTPCASGWVVQSSPNPDPSRNWLNDVLAFSEDDAWAVGAYGSSFYGTQRALIEHWDGTSWAVIPGLEIYTNGELLAIDGLNSHDIWAVGYSGTTAGPLTLHWDGTQWNLLPAPLPPSSSGGGLRAITAISHDDVWAVGSYSIPGNHYNLTLHWDGTQWSVVPCPTHPYSELFAVDAASSDDVWAVGGESNVAGRTVLMHWDGSAWSASLSTFAGNFFDVAAIASDDVWAVGTYFPNSQYYGIFAHWDGVRWTQYPSLVGGVVLKLAALSSADIWTIGGPSGITTHWDGTHWMPILDSFPGHPAANPGGIDVIPGRVWVVGSDPLAGQQSRTFAAYYDTTCPTATPAITSTPTLTPTQVTCMSGWTINDSPNTDRQYDRLYAVDALSSTDVWAVGSSEDANDFSIEFSDSVTMHWNGAAWDRVPSPNPGRAVVLNGVSAIAHDDVWAVGSSGTTFTGTLAIHWNGYVWTAVSPQLNGYLYAVDAVSSNDVWAVGKFDSGGALALHWDGTMWSQATIPLPVGVSSLNGIAAISANDVWAVGYGHEGSFSTTFIVHWDGQQWVRVPTPVVLDRHQLLHSVSGSSADDVWAVGEQGGRALILHWDGTSWTESLSNSAPKLLGVLSITANDAWAFGLVSAWHWNGISWSLVSTPDPYPSGFTLNAGVALSSSEVWAVGSLGFGSVGSGWTETLTELFTGTCSPPTPIATFTATMTKTPTATRTPTISPTTTTPTSTRTQTQMPFTTATITTVSSASATAIPEPTCGAYWRVETSPNVGTSNNFIYGVAALSANDVWAVGFYNGGASSQGQTLTMHYTSEQWQIVPSPNVGPGGNYLRSVAVAPGGEVWAVGQYESFGTKPLVMHYVNRQWEIVTTPDIGGPLYDVAAPSTDDVWVVGQGTGGTGPSQALTMHYTGGQWQLVSPPAIGSSSVLVSVTALSSQDVWAAGYYMADGIDHTLTMHLVSGQWQVVSSPNIGAGDNMLNGISAISPDDIWSVGDYYNGSMTQPLVLHYTNGQWQIVSIPGIGLNSTLADVGAVSTGDVWAVGRYQTVIGQENHTLTMHYANGQWQIVPSPDSGTSPGNFLNSVAVISGNYVWAVGSAGTNSIAFRTLTLRYFDPCPTPTSTATATATATSSTNTATVVPSNTPQGTVTPTAGVATGTSIFQTATVTTTATTCSIAFSDVATDSAFYTFIRCLSCRGIISGYDDGTFRPLNEITRGQIAKIVSNAAALNQDPGPQIFEDVNSTNTFYIWINRLVNSGYMGGYPCGGEAEPCDESNLPYFRPFANATRGQLAKIVSNAAGIGGAPTGQLYTDVTEDHPFYTWIMRLTELGVMRGYECGGEGEPCDSENRPYFRPFNNVTRGQASKIVANTFFPGCQTP